MSIYIDEKLRQETRMIATETPAGIVMIENTLDDCNKVTNMCSGGSECPVRRFSLFSNGRPGKPHWAGARENLIMTAQNGAHYRLRFRKDTRALHKATRVGKCNLVTLEKGSKLTPKQQLKELEGYTGELIEVLILFGDYLSTFKTVWSLTTDMANKKAFREFFSKVEDEDWISLIGFLDTPEFRKTVPKVRGENRIQHQQDIKERQLVCLEYIKPFVKRAFMTTMINESEYQTLMQIWFKTRADVKNKGRKGETAFPPLRATETQINVFLGLENDPINLTPQFRKLRKDAARSGSSSLKGTLEMSDEEYENLPQKRSFEREET
tara:strand:- start:788 stop:1759 length:972 start_codon:yes stop_codon:yes gene_type:complete